MKIYNHKIINFFPLVFFSHILLSQTSYQVVTRKIQKEFSFSESDYLIINAEKGIIDIQPWEEKKVRVIATIVVKNQDLNMAKKELEYIKWDAFEKNRELKLYNSILLPQGKELTSIVRVEYTILIPQGAHFSVYNKFGQVNVSNLRCLSKYNLQYCDMNLKNITGAVHITSNVGDLFLNDINGLLQITSRYSSVNLSNLSGNAGVTATYGDIKANITNKLSNLTITAERCDVVLTNKICQEINLNLETKYGELNLLESCYAKDKSLIMKKTTGSAPNTTKTYNYTTPEAENFLKIKNIYGNITLN